MQSQPLGRLRQLDAVRGLAALSVVIWHYWLLFDTGSQFPVMEKARAVLTLTPLYAAFAGHQAVLVFFVLSGFALTLMVRAGSNYWNYLYRRVCRLYLPYLVAVALAVAACALFYDGPITLFSDRFATFWALPITGRSLLDHLLFIHAYKDSQYDYVLWSLVQEMRLSLLFPLLLWGLVRLGWKRGLAALFGISLIGGAGYFLVVHRSPPAANALLTLHFSLMFGVGALIALHHDALGAWYRALSGQGKAALFSAGLLSYVYGVLPDRVGIGNPTLNDWLTLPGAVTVIMFALYSGRAIRVLLRPLPQFLGRISFSLYLIHPVVQLGMLYGLRGVLPLPWVAALAFVLTFPIATLMYLWVERPSMALGRRWQVRSNLSKGLSANAND
jgi:peptidoglycan/LPS O-acetylase OafA/YrhL